MAFSESEPEEATANNRRFASKVANIESQGSAYMHQMVG